MIIFVLGLLGFCVFLWLANLGVCSWSRDWPVLLILTGLLMVVSALRPNRRRRIIADLARGRINAAQAAERLESLNH